MHEKFQALVLQIVSVTTIEELDEIQRSLRTDNYNAIWFGESVEECDIRYDAIFSLIQTKRESIKYQEIRKHAKMLNSLL